MPRNSGPKGGSPPSLGVGGWVSARRPPHACPGVGGWVSGARKRRRIVDHGELDARLRARRCSGAAILTSLTRQAHMRGAMQSAMQSACGRLTCADGISDRKCSASERRRDRRRVGGWGRRRPCSGSGGVVGSAKPTPLLALSSEALRKGAVPSVSFYARPCPVKVIERTKTLRAIMSY